MPTDYLPAGVFDGVSTVLIRSPGLPDDPLELVAGPRPSELNLLAVLYRRPTAAFVEAWNDRIGRRPRDLRIVDVDDTMRSVADPGDAGETQPNVVRAVERPGDCESIERLVDRYLEEWSDEDGSSVVYVDSLAAPMEVVEPVRVAEFLGRLTATCRRWGAIGHVRARIDRHDERTLDGLELRLDAAVELTADGDGRPYEVRNPGSARALAGTAGDGPDFDAVIDLLAAPERRAVLGHLAVSHRASMDELAATLARRSGAGDDLPGDRERAFVALYQFHVPKLVDAGVVHHDAARDVVELADGADGVLPMLQLAMAYETR